jgi:hypothetical protein
MANDVKMVPVAEEVKEFMANNKISKKASLN